MNISEIFASIQGESTLAGIPTVFVRLAGCNLSCTYCDTPYAQGDGDNISVADILTRIESFHLRTVCITGGEPLLQDDLPALVEKLRTAGYKISIETNGSLPTAWIPSDVTAVIDVKCPGSGEAGTFYEPNAIGRRPRDQFKFVLTDRRDFEWACAFVEKHTFDETNEVLFSPAVSSLAPATLADWIVREFPRARLNLQLHRIIWPEADRGH